jgi:hypothetical protein
MGKYSVALQYINKAAKYLDGINQSLGNNIAPQLVMIIAAAH